MPRPSPRPLAPPIRSNTSPTPTPPPPWASRSSPRAAWPASPRGRRPRRAAPRLTPGLPRLGAAVPTALGAPPRSTCETLSVDPLREAQGAAPTSNGVAAVGSTGIDTSSCHSGTRSKCREEEARQCGRQGEQKVITQIWCYC
ncbi:hypothetical protein PVAP13_3KG368000 [Panicum virgatum]|uniref:Uncharacterized protein n=1 Tax=Panicum virgatum TaxID=38727 RepID=A0A8T0UZL5_PANVG|nr:hypothetical protein PVAP13_3KG368000 [Panicum virgatum]KAG2626545.1 hypothetical protein PVAP13_3KG368000 [Panicum virgatum]